MARKRVRGLDSIRTHFDALAHKQTLQLSPREFRYPKAYITQRGRSCFSVFSVALAMFCPPSFSLCSRAPS
jgi:hypothetical protein